MSSVIAPTRSGGRVLLSRVMNGVFWLVFCAMSGTGFLLAFRLPPGSRGGQGLSVLGLGRHDWGDVHTWLSYAFLALMAAHLALHWRWLWQVAARRRSWPLVAGLGAGFLLMLAFFFLPVESRERGGGRQGRAEHHESH